MPCPNPYLKAGCKGPPSCNVAGCRRNDPRPQLSQSLEDWMQQSQNSESDQSSEGVVLTEAREKLLNSVRQLKDELNSYESVNTTNI